jgi:hypothetical protein
VIDDEDVDPDELDESKQAPIFADDATDDAEGVYDELFE